MHSKGMTLIEVLIAMFILSIGLVGVLGAMPTGINSAQTVILQDCAIHLAHSKFAEFRRDRVNPSVDLLEGSSYLLNWQEPLNASPGNVWRDFAHGPGDTYQYFDEILRYEWCVDQVELAKGAVSSASTVPPPAANYFAPDHSAGGSELRLVRVIVRLKGTSKEHGFSQYIGNLGRVAPLDKTP
jgi:prepilin-type N-terminal cleavage/methylation domain-containing protein